MYIYIIYIYEWRTKLRTARNGHGQSGWSPIGCEGLYFHGMYKNRVQAPVEVRIKHRGVGTTAWNAPVTSKSEKAGPGSEILLVTLQRWGQISTSKCYWRC